MPTKRVMILGVTGSLGGYLLNAFHSKYDVVCPQPKCQTERTQGPIWLADPLEIENTASLSRLVRDAAPEIIINCVAVTPRSRFTASRRQNIQVNSLFPRRLAKVAKDCGAYVIHIGTDGVFSGRKGSYGEQDLPDPEDLYGRSKLLGELHGQQCLTLRTTFLGVFPTGAGLVGWYLQQGFQTVDGYTNYRFSPISVQRLAMTIEQIIETRDRPHGVFHAGGEAITKFQILQCIRKAIRRGGAIRPVDTPVCDRSLDSSCFWKRLGRPVPSVCELVGHLQSELQNICPARQCG